jgi:hypothetical protein
MRTSHRIASALALALLGIAGTPERGRAQAMIGGNGFQNGFAINGLNNGFGGFNNGFGGFNNGFGGFNNGFAGGFVPMAAVGGGFGPMGFNNGGVAAFGFGGPMNGGMTMFYGNGVGFGGNFAGQPGFGFNPMGVPMGPQAFAANNLGGVAAAIDQQVVRRPGGALPAVRRRRR